jgi:hypothetical protein
MTLTYILYMIYWITMIIQYMSHIIMSYLTGLQYIYSNEYIVGYESNNVNRFNICQ